MAINNDAGVQDLLAQMRALSAQAAGGTQATNASATEVPDFSNMMKSAIDKVNETQKLSGEMSTAFQKGDPNVDMADLMVQMQKASISFQAMVQVRNRLVSAYQDIMNMPV